MAPRKSNKKTNRIKGEEFLKFRCNRCGVCCRLRIPVTDVDVRRLMEGTGLPVEKIVHFFKKSEFGKTPGRMAWIKFGPRKKDIKAMCLRETRDRCLFLRVKKGCIAYEHRPIVCREHPFDLTLDESGRTIMEVEMNDVAPCSRTLDGKVDTKRLKRIHHLSLKQDEDYYPKVRRWNRRKNPGNERDFLKYLGLTD